MSEQPQLFDDPRTPKWIEYDNENPHMYQQFKQLAYDEAQMHSYSSAYMLREVLRWKTRARGTGEFKVPNDITPWWSRKFMNEFPEYNEFFKIKETKYDYGEME